MNRKLSQLFAFLRGETDDPGWVSVRRGGIQWPTPGPPGPHVYLSSACRHAADPDRTERERAELHRKCQHDTIRYDGTHKKAAQCKECGAPCICPCHKETYPLADTDAFARTETIAQTGGWCMPTTDFCEQLADPRPCDGINHRWERVYHQCTECGRRQPPRTLACEACDAILREGDSQIPPSHFKRLWKATPK